MDWILIPILFAVVGGLSYGMAKASKEGKGIGSDELFPGSKDSPDTKNHWTEYVVDDEETEEEEEKSRHWTEYVHDDDTRDRDDEWEEEREDDWGDPY